MPRGIPGSGKPKKPAGGATAAQLEGMARARAARAQRLAQAAAVPQNDPLREARAVKATAAVDPDAAVHRLVDQAQGVAQPPPRVKPPSYVTPAPDDIDAQVHFEAIKMLQAEQRKADAAAAARSGKRGSVADEDRGRVPIELFIDNPEMPNELAFEDDDGTNLLLPGYRGRWVRVKEELNQARDNTIRMRRFAAWGARPIIKKNKEPLRMETLVAMQIPIMQDARRIIKASPSGAFDTAKQIHHLSNVADKENSQMSSRFHGLSKGVVGLTVGEGHGQSSYESEDILDRD